MVNAKVSFINDSGLEAKTDEIKVIVSIYRVVGVAVNIGGIE